MTLRAKMAMSDLQRYLWKMCLKKCWLNMFFFCFFFNYLFQFVDFLQKWFAHFLLMRNNGGNFIIKQSWVRKTAPSSSSFIRLRFQGYCCKSDIVIFVRRVTWNCAYCPFNAKQTDSRLGYSEVELVQCMIDGVNSLVKVNHLNNLYRPNQGN